MCYFISIKKLRLEIYQHGITIITIVIKVISAIKT